MHDSCTILCVGDLHIGRPSSKCRKEGEAPGAHSARLAWQQIVRCAIDRQVKLLLLTGDVIDREGNLYEAISPFAMGIAELVEAGIEVALIAGNHDLRALPRLATILDNPHVHLLGRHAQWERFDWPDEENPILSILGYCYPDSTPGSLPLTDLPAHRLAGLPTIALAHVDYLSPSSNYLCASPDALRATSGIDCWVLGHIHYPALLNENGPIILNAGTPQALHPNESGPHGPWLLEVEGGRFTRPVQLPISSVVYATVEEDISLCATIDEVLAQVRHGLERCAHAHRHAEYRPRLSCRITLRGRTPLFQQCQEECEKWLNAQPLLDTDDIYLDQFNYNNLAPAIDLEKLAQRDDVIGALAGMLHALEAGGDDTRTTNMLASVEALRGSLRTTPPFDQVDAPSLPSAADTLKNETLRLLDALLRQQEART